MSLHMHGCHTNTDISVCSIHVQLPACTFFNLCVCVCFYMLFTPSIWELLVTVWYSKSGRIPDGIMGRDVYGIPEWLKARLHWSPPLPFFFLTPPSFTPFNPGVPPLLSLFLSLSFSVSLLPSLCPVFVSAHPCPFICPLFFLLLMCVGNKSVCMCVTEGVTCDQAGSVAAWSHRISAYRTKFHLH